MQTTKIGAVSALLIATLAVAFAPTAAADDVTTCPAYLDEDDAESAVEVAQCEAGVVLFCMTDASVPHEKRAFCLIGE